MRSDKTLSRRTLIWTAVAASAGWGLRRILGVAVYGRAAVLPGASLLAELCSDLACPASIGRACVQALPAADASPERLVRAILTGLPAGGDLGAKTTLRQALGLLSRSDFRDGRIVLVDGWVLSLAETRLYALASRLR